MPVFAHRVKIISGQIFKPAGMRDQLSRRKYQPLVDRFETVIHKVIPTFAAEREHPFEHERLDSLPHPVYRLGREYLPRRHKFFAELLSDLFQRRENRDLGFAALPESQPEGDSYVKIPVFNRFLGVIVFVNHLLPNLSHITCTHTLS